MRSPWFITQNGTLGEILHQFRRNNQSVAVVLNEPGSAVGVITLEGVLDEVFGKITPISSGRQLQTVLALDKTYPGDTRISKFNQDLGVSLDSKGAITLAGLVEKELGHHPKKGEAVQVGQFRLEVVETTLLEVRKVRVHTRTR
jgi:CBS domain containing-hemolysin-like protein